MSDSPKTPHRRLAWKVAPDLFTSFRYASDGLWYTFLSQRNFRIHVAVGVFVLGLAVWLHLSATDVAVLVLLIALMLGLELVNTAIESVVDLTIGKTYHDLAKIAKDCAAAAVLVNGLSAVAIGCLIILPPLFTTVGQWLRP
jgi:diacylglycerol kinase (ATP)